MFQLSRIYNSLYHFRRIIINLERHWRSMLYVCTKMSIHTKWANQWRDSKIARLFWVYIVLVIYKFVVRHHVCTRWRQSKVFEYLIIGILHPVLGWKLVIIYSMFSSVKGWHMSLAICSSKWIILPWWTSAVRVSKSQGMVTALCQNLSNWDFHSTVSSLVNSWDQLISLFWFSAINLQF